MITPPYSYLAVLAIILFAIWCVRWIIAKPKPTFRSNDAMDEDWFLFGD